MPKCLNCGRETMRTSDWCCQWCGNPLFSNAFKSLNKSFSECKTERLDLESSIKDEGNQDDVYVEEEVEIKFTDLEQKPQDEVKLKSGLNDSEEKQDDSDSKMELPQFPSIVEDQPLTESDISVQIETPQPDTIDNKLSDLEDTKEAANEKLNVDELLATYDADATAADTRFKNKVLQINGNVVMIDVREMMETHYIRIAGSDDNLLKSIKCLFRQEHTPVLSKLVKGQAVTVQGRFTGSLIDIRLANCSIIQM